MSDLVTTLGSSVTWASDAATSGYLDRYEPCYAHRCTATSIQTYGINWVGSGWWCERKDTPPTSATY